MANKDWKQHLKQLTDNYKELLDKFHNPAVHHGIKWSDVTDARQAVDDYRNELMRSGTMPPPKAEKGEGE